MQHIPKAPIFKLSKARQLISNLINHSQIATFSNFQIGIGTLPHWHIGTLNFHFQIKQGKSANQQFNQSFSNYHIFNFSN